MDVPQYHAGQQLPGTVYRVVRHLATGGMGSVYDVEDVSIEKRYVLKTLHPQLVARQDLAKRMQAEGRALGKLHHPNIVDVVTAGVTNDERRTPFYVMERLNGQNLRVVIEKRGRLEVAHCFRIAIDVLEALEHAHENAVIHRDVKPENIFLHRNANGTTITKLLDFGIMRLLDRKESHTQGKFIGTLRYASPEQIFGGELGPPTDIYSLGIVLYEMLAGRGPFDDVGDAYAIGAAHAQRPPPPLSTFVALPQALENLVMSALAKSPRDRPRDCFTFASELRRMQREEEAAPRSATQMNVLSSVPPTRAHQTPEELAGTEQANSTAVGMLPPSAQPSEVPAAVLVPITAGGRPVVGNMNGATALGGAATLASEPPAALGAVPAVVNARPMIDREAPTHASGVSGVTQRLAMNDTSMAAFDELLGPLPPPDAMRGALPPRDALEVAATSHARRDSQRPALGFPPAQPDEASTGPLAGEARTRPPGERGMLLPLLGAAALGALLVGGAVLFVTKPWNKRSSASTAASSVVAPPAPNASTAADPPAASPPRPMAAAAAASASAVPLPTPAIPSPIPAKAISVPAAEPRVGRSPPRPVVVRPEPAAPTPLAAPPPAPVAAPAAPAPAPHKDTDKPASPGDPNKVKWD